MPKKKVSPRVDAGAVGDLIAIFGNESAGAQFAAEAFPNLYWESLSRMAGKFSEAELKGIIDAYNGVMLTPMLAGQSIQGDMEQVIRFDGMAEKWGFNGPSLLAKLEALSPFERASLEIFAVGFWKAAAPAEKTIEEYIRPLSADVPF